ncbi:hypothetical protein [Nonomuraea insulae]|uniref:FtsK domain-containing protein n=1 Tax=Nonomuraea insulae TaxID=1616787 RepID=A0ABW1D212_9ACTN
MDETRPDASTELEPVIYEAEVIEPTSTMEVQRIRRLTRRAVAAAKGLLVHPLAVLQGWHSWTLRAWDALTLGVYRRQIRAAEATGDRAGLAEWVERKGLAVRERHIRLMDMPHVVFGLLKVIVAILLTVTLVIPLIALLVWMVGGDGGAVFRWVGGTIRWLFDAVAFLWWPFLVSLPIVAVLGGWREGRRRGRPPTWLATASDADIDVTIDETTIARALGALRIPQITTYLKQGLPLQFIVPARRDGRGTHAVLRLPAGVPAEKLGQRRADLATGLYRAAKEVWPTTGSEAGILDLWVADKGALAEGAGPYPLLTAGTTDVFKGVPFGRTLRGDPMIAPLMERNTITGGMPGQGKSSAARVIMAGAALDPTAELRIWVPDANFDFECFKRRCSRYVMGAEDEKIERILFHLRELYAEVQSRGGLLIEYQEPAVTRKLASAGVGLHPLICLLEEAHIAITHKTHGEEISELLKDIVRLGRKRGIHLIVSTQAPTKDSMPRDVTRNCSNGVAFAVGDHVANDALLGAGAYRGGHRATELLPGVDRGTAIVKGFTGERSDIVQVYFLSISKENDQVTPIIDRAMAAMQGVPDRPQAEGSRDLLADLDAVMGDDRVRLADLPGLLRQLAPDWFPYKSLTGSQLRDLLTREHGVRVTNTGNVPRLDPADVRRALSEQDESE